MIDRQGASQLSGPPLIAAITSVCSAGFLLFGYDQGVMSGVVVSQYWLAQMSHPSTVMIGTITALYDVGAALGAICAAFTAEPLGRKRSLLLGAAILTLGSIIMGAAFERVQFMVSRIVTGVGIGYITSVTPVYQSEISSAAQRGWHVCCQLTTMLGGLMLAYWINYGMYYHPGSVQWRFPLLFQCVFSLYILAVTPWLPDTPRWLMRHAGAPDQGLAVLARLRGEAPEHPVVQREKDEIVEAIGIESKEEGSWLDLFKGHGIASHKRFYLALGIQFMQQMSGINIVTYYAPTLFQSSLGMTQEMALFLGCFLQLWYVLASFLTWYLIDRIGRRKLFVTMALGMSLVLVSEAICVALNTPRAAIAAVVFVFLFEACFTWGWMATVWLYPAEILPLKIRAKGAALAAAADFLGNFLVVEITPPALANIGYRTYIIFAVLNVANAAVVWCFYPETAGQTLEAVDRVFAKRDDGFLGEERDRWYRKVQWEMVARAARAREVGRRAEGQRGGLGGAEAGKGYEERVERGGEGLSS
ncbi:hypothetical protein MMC13_000780 [Lambiella insularis]|nr:hypothetical protein [Lambiella insularis]